MQVSNNVNTDRDSFKFIKLLNSTKIKNYNSR
jgi:hypothetical protein